jgi:flagellar basal body rod protein FlgG
MNRTVYTVTSGALAALARLDTVAQNLANASTAGYKAARLVFEVRPLEAASAAAVGDGTAGTAAQVAELATVRDFSQGPVRPSGNPLDVALTGPGFFVVATPRGERYTRQGTFALDGEGYLVTQGGERVQGDGGDLRVGEGTVAIGGDGGVTVDGTAVGRLKVVDFGERPALVPEGNALFAPAPGAVAAPLDAAAVRMEPGAIEGANIDAVAGLVELVEVARGFESYMQAMQRLDQVAQRSITDVGRVG